ncbi:hypothetical protein RR46_07490 [Papilio xuthus]|uniref:Uncharacterized protein n=1 Tax=Papilio xuthus TaxID=66420 RepID=A0A194QB51_PAPXU|nr:hypothetical protein RR46_07490 [Papilio xuthus]
MALEGVKSEKSEENNANGPDGKANGIENKSKQGSVHGVHCPPSRAASPPSAADADRIADESESVPVVPSRCFGGTERFSGLPPAAEAHDSNNQWSGLQRQEPSYDACGI